MIQPAFELKPIWKTEEPRELTREEQTLYRDLYCDDYYSRIWSTSLSDEERKFKLTTTEELEAEKHILKYTWLGYVKECIFGLMAFNNIVVTNCTTDKGTQNQSIVMTTDPYRGLLTLTSGTLGPTLVFSGSDDATELLNPLWIQSVCGSLSFSIMQGPFFPPGPLMYQINCTDSPAHSFNISTVAAFGSNAASVYVNGQILYSGFSTQTALQTAPSITQAYCSYLYQSASNGTTCINGICGNLQITSTSGTIAITNQVNSIDLEAITIRAGGKTFSGNTLIPFISDSNIVISNPAADQLQWSIPAIVNKIQAAGVNYTGNVLFSSSSSQLLVTSGPNGIILGINVNASSSNVSSINGQGGAINLANGSNINIIQSGNTFTFEVVATLPVSVGGTGTVL